MKTIAPELITRVLTREDHLCQMCGAKAETAGWLVPPQAGGHEETDNLRALCKDCSEGASALPYMPRPSRIELLTQVRRATVKDQRAAMEWLQQRLARY